MKIEIDLKKKTIQIIEGGKLEELTSIMTKHNLLDFTIISKNNIVLKEIEKDTKPFPYTPYIPTTPSVPWRKPWEPIIVYINNQIDRTPIKPNPFLGWQTNCSNEIS